MKESDIIKELEKLSLKAYKNGEIPIASIVTKNGKLIAKAYNLKEKKKIATYHAEIIAINKASKHMKDWRLNNCILYTTLFPCPMCAAAISQSRINKVIYMFDTRNEKEKKISKKLLERVKLEYIESNNNIINDFFKKIRE